MVQLRRNRLRTAVTMCLLLLMIVAGTPSIADETSTLIVSGRAKWKPFLEYNTTLDRANGILLDILRYAAHENGCFIQYVNLPWKRVILHFETGLIDVICGILWNKKRENEYNFSTVIATNEIKVFVKNYFKLKSLDDLVGKRGDCVLGASYGDKLDAFIKSEKAQFTRLVSDSNIIDRLHRGYSDFFIASTIDGLYRIQEKKMEDTIFPLPYVVDIVKVHFAFADKPKRRLLYEKIKNTIQEMKTNGTMQAIYDKYM